MGEQLVWFDEDDGGATISECGTFRYLLWRRWGDGPVMAWVMLNPSTADASLDDPTIRRCIGFAKREGCAGIDVVNLYAGRATDPKALLSMDDPEGRSNRLAWACSAIYSDNVSLVVAAWGASADTLRLAPSLALQGYNGPPMVCLGTTKAGHPRHPLYVKADTPLVPFHG